MKKFKYLITAIIFISTSLITIPASSAAEKGYRYWGYFQAAPGKTIWTAAMTGPTVDVADGSVEGWVFTFSGGSVKSAAQPKTAPSFATICKGVKTEADTKRVALVIDFGTRVLSPKGEKIPKSITKCITAAKESVGADILGMALKIRAGASGFICGLNGYPAKECGVEIPTPKSLIPKK